MSVSDPMSDMLTRIRNANKAKRPEVSMPSSRMKVAVAEVMKTAGFIESCRVEGETTYKKTLTLVLKYHGKGKQPVIEGIKGISKPSCRIYVSSREIPRVMSGLGLSILSTPQGIMSGKAARKQNVGGEVICHMW